MKRFLRLLKPVSAVLPAFASVLPADIEAGSSCGNTALLSESCVPAVRIMSKDAQTFEMFISIAIGSLILIAVLYVIDKKRK